MQRSPLISVDVAHLLKSDAAATATWLRAQRVVLHCKNVPWAVTGVLLLLSVFASLQWHAVPPVQLLVWAVTLLAVMAWRACLCYWQRRGGQPSGGATGLLWHYRANFLAHGLVWASASALPPDDPMQLAVLMMVLAGVCSANFVLNAFDVVAALLFGVPAMAALALRLLLSNDYTHLVLGAAVLVSLGFLTVLSMRASRVVRENTLLRMAESRQTYLLRVLIEATSEGFWFIDNEDRTVDVNPAMCEILGLSREQLQGRSIFDFVDAENRAMLEIHGGLRASGGSRGCEVTLLCSGGRRVDCYSQATPLIDDSGVRVGSVVMLIDISDRKRNERALREASEALRQKSQALEDTLASIAQGIVHYDSQGRLRTYNQRLLELLELPQNLFHADTHHRDVSTYLVNRGDLREGAQLLDATGQPLPAQLKPSELPDLYVRRTPAGLLLEVRTRRLQDGGMVRTFSDVTDYIQALRNLAAREHEQRDLLAAFPGVITVVDEQLRYTYVNQRFADLLGKPPEQIVGQLMVEMVNPECFELVRGTLEQARRRSPVTLECVYPANPQRPQVILQVTHTISHDPATGRERLFAFGVDISARKAAEAALMAARDEAERANKAKSQFLSSMSHELRTPLNAIVGFGDLLVSDDRHPLQPGQRRHMDEILRGGRHLLHLINELLDLAVVESGSLPVRLCPVALAPAFEEVLALLRPLASTRGVELPVTASGLSSGAAVQADPVRLKQVLLNLIGNAIKYNRQNGQVRVLCQQKSSAATKSAAGDAHASNGIWHITVTDTGPGLSAVQQSRLFDAFERVGADATFVEGTGLGLALSRGLVQAMGGDIGVDSQTGQGSSFWFQLPAAPEGSAPAQGWDGPQAQAAAGNPWLTAMGVHAMHSTQTEVLYIEDNSVNCMLLEAIFENLPGLVLRTAGTAAAGLQTALEAPPALLLMDVQLPDMDGPKLLQSMRQFSSLRDIPAVALSADATPEAMARCKAAGFSDYLTKPLDLNRLLVVLKEQLRAG